MNIRHRQLVELCKKVSPTHHSVWLRQDGADPDWPLWYSQWLMAHTDSVHVLGSDIIVSHLICFSAEADREYVAPDNPQQKWPEYYAEKLIGLYDD